MAFVPRIERLLIAGLVTMLLVAPAGAINIALNYTYDTNNFFGSGNPQGATAGAQAKTALEAAATFLSNVLADSFSAITVPAPYHSTFPGSTGLVTWTFEQRFQHPSGTTQISVPNASIPSSNVAANQYIVYVGARSLAGSTAGVGAVGGLFRGNAITGTNQFTSADIDYINQTTASFFDAVDHRGQASGFANWGGSVSFDLDNSPPWHFNHTTSPPAGAVDFYSVAIHEMIHSLGFGGSAEWNSFVSGSNFVGANAVAAYGSSVPLSADKNHWANGTMSTIYGSSTAQETAMDPDLTNGTRKLMTNLDAAALKDIGWTLVPPPGVQGDYNGNGVVDAADYVTWRNGGPLLNDPTPGVQAADYSFWRSRFGATSGSGSGGVVGAVPEPSTVVLVAIAGVRVFSVRHTRRR